MSGLDYSTLDPGIRETVRWLRDRGYSTTDSGDGVTKREAIAAGEALDEPHVFMVVKPSEMVRSARTLRVHLKMRGVPHRIEASYEPESDVSILMLFGVNDETLRGKL